MILSHGRRLCLCLMPMLWVSAAPGAVGQASAWPLQLTGRFARTLEVSSPLTLEVVTGAGDIQVRSGPPGHVSITGRVTVGGGWWHGRRYRERKLQEVVANPPIEQRANSVRVGRSDEPFALRDVSISYVIVAPSETRLSLHSGSGDLIVSGLRGPLEAHTGSGDIHARDLGSELHARTGSGDIELLSVRGPVETSSGSGSVTADGVAGAFRASTGSGEVSLRQVAPGAVDVEVGSGSVRLSGLRGGVRVRTGSGDVRASGEPSAEWQLRTSSGDVTLQVPSSFAFDLYAHTGSGEVWSGHPLAVQGSLGRHELRGKAAGGGTAVTVETGSGDIRIE